MNNPTPDTLFLNASHALSIRMTPSGAVFVGLRSLEFEEKPQQEEKEKSNGK